MDLVLRDDQVELRDELRRMLADRCDGDARRAAMAMPGAVDRKLWTDLAGMGVFSLALPEADGGVGLGMAEAVVAFEELGAALVPGPVVATFLAAGMLDAEVVGAVPAGDGPALVEHLGGIDALVVASRDSLVLVDPPAGLDPVERPLDPLTPVTVVPSLPDGAPLGTPDDAARWHRDGALLSAALHVGLGRAAVELGTEHAKDRQQFGRVIGSFQAVKHLLADAVVGVEIARAAVHAAAVALDEGGDPTGHHSVEAARIVASRAADRAARACIQVHGGMGYTWELDAHLYLKRTLVLDQSWLTPEDAVGANAVAM